MPLAQPEAAHLQKAEETMERRTGLTIIALSASLAAACGGAEPSDEPSGNISAQEGYKSCVMNLTTNESSCFGTFTEAMFFATKGRITDAPPMAKFMDESFAARVNVRAEIRGEQPITPDFTPVIGWVYHNWWGGTDWAFLGSACDANKATSEHEVPNLNTSPYTNSSLNDNISSWQSTPDTNCHAVFYGDWYFGGPNSGTPAYSGVFQSTDPMNDQASSIKWF
jgi:hypothetical protein